MVPQPSFRLDARIGWRIGARSNIAALAGRLELTATPAVPVPLPCSAAALAGVTTPLQAALTAGGTLWILDAAGTVWRFDPCGGGFAPLPCVTIPGGVIAIAAVADELLVLERNARRVTVFNLHTLRIRCRWGPFAGPELAPARPHPLLDPVTAIDTGAIAFSPGSWDPRGLAVLSHNRIAVTDFTSSRVQIFDRRGTHCAAWGDAGAHPALVGPTAIAATGDGGVFVVEAGVPGVAHLGAEGTIIARSGSDAAMPRFDPGLVNVDADGSLWLGEPATGAMQVIRRNCAGRCLPAAAVPGDLGCTLLGFGPDGRPILSTPNQKTPLKGLFLRYAEAGWAIIGPLGAGMAGTVWDRLRCDGQTPAGTRLIAETFTTDLDFAASEVGALGPERWSATELGIPAGTAIASAIRSAPGRWLWLRISITGDTTATAHLTAITASYPRATSMRYLPGAFAADPVNADFLARFLGIFDEIRDRSLDPVDRLPALFDPNAAPALPPGAPGEDFLDWLGGWIGLALDRNWSIARRRRLVAEAPSLFRIAGTTAGLKRHVAVYTGTQPRLVEHYRLRRWLNLDETRLDSQAALWGPEIIRRLQLDAYSRIGEFTLVDGGNPLTDPFDAFAHRATLYVPVSDGFTDADLAALETVVAAAAPAHVLVDIKLMRPRYVVGCDLVIGVNTVIGRDSRPAVTDTAILGEDIRLGGDPATFSLRPGLRLGVDTILE